MTLNHLSAEARKQAQLDDAVRLNLLQRDRWIDYPRAVQARETLERLLATPRRERMPCLLIHGDSNIGKTLILRKFQRDHPNQFDETAGVERREIVAMQMPATPDQHRFYAALLFELGAPHSPTARLSVLERLARELLRKMAPRMLIVDEVHHLLAGNYQEQRASLNLLKYLANDLKMCIVLAGTADARIAVQSDAQMSSRFASFEIARWKESEEFRNLLKSFARVLPLRKASELDLKPVVQFIQAASGGLTGEVSRMLNSAAEMAIRDRTERISLEHLEHVATLAV